VTGLVFRSAKVVLTGAQTEEECKRAALRICRRINYAVYRNAETTKLNLPYGFHVHNFKIENVVGTFQIPHQLKLNVLYNEWKTANNENVILLENLQLKKIIYDPEHFPGLRMQYITDVDNAVRRRIMCMLFNNGKCIVTGSKCEAYAKKFSYQLYLSAIRYSK